MLARIRTSIEVNDEGFTLIELLVVIIIIGILAAIAIPVFLNQRKKGYDASMKSDLSTVANEEESYFVDTQTYSGVTTSTTKFVVGSDTISLSPGTSVTATHYTANGYCLKATNTHDTANVYYYDSQSGGLQPANVVCPSTFS